MRRMQVAATTILALGAAAIGAGNVQAQGVSSASPFHAGQWGIEAYATPNNGGLLYFVTNQTALVLGATGQRTTTHQDLSGVGNSKTVGTNLDVTLGLRHHKTFAPGMALIAGGGAFVGSLRQRSEFLGTTSRYRTSYYGGYGEIGGQYMPVNHFAIGLAYRLEVRRTRNRNADMTGLGIGTEFTPVRVTLYF